jgi:FkbM family methyltransferase
MNRKFLDLGWWQEALIPRARALRARLRFNPKVIDKTVEGVSFKFFVSSPVAAAWYGNSGSDSSIEMRFVRDRMMRSGAKVIECGAHHGYDTILLSRWVGNAGCVYACEPMPDNIQVIERNLALNEIKNVRIVPKALGPSSGSVRFRAQTNSAPLGNQKGSGIVVAVTTVDDLSEAGCFIPDLIKIDVEGYEIDLLEGASRTLQHRPALLVEVHPHQVGNFDKTVDQLWDLIDHRAYELWHQPHDLAPVSRISGPIPIVRRSHIYCIPQSSIG